MPLCSVVGRMTNPDLVLQWLVLPAISVGNLGKLLEVVLVQPCWRVLEQVCRYYP